MAKFTSIVILALVFVGTTLGVPHKGPRRIQPNLPDPNPSPEVRSVAHPILGSDMRLNDAQKDPKSGIPEEQWRWRGGIYFQIDRAFSQSEYDTIYAALGDLAGATCIGVYEWPQDANPGGDYVFIQRGGDGSGCWSWVGRQGGRQELNLQGNGCVYRDIALHEAIHAYGFFHEQSRTDRDNHVQILWQNIPGDVAYNFDIQNSNHFNVGYDYYSIMHYDQYAFSANGQKTIQAWDTGIDVGSRGELTGLDRDKLWRMYC